MLNFRILSKFVTPNIEELSLTLGKCFMFKLNKLSNFLFQINFLLSKNKVLEAFVKSVKYDLFFVNL